MTTTKTFRIYLGFALALYSILNAGITYAYTSNSGGQNCAGKPITNIDELKSASQVINYNAPSSGALSCSTGYYIGGNWSAWIWTGNSYSCPFQSYASQIQTSGGQYRIYCKTKDTTPPGTPTISGTQFLANNSQLITFNYPPDGGAPINSIVVEIERNDNPGLFYTYSSSSVPFTIPNMNISDVDTFKDAIGQRNYTVRINQICDAGGNCSCYAGGGCGNPTLPNYTLNVFANTLTAASNSSADISQAIPTQVADGTSHAINLNLKDIYGNSIVPVAAIGRTVNMKLNVTNTDFLDQYKLTGGSGVLFNTPSNGSFLDIFSYGTATTSFLNLPSSNGIYTYNYKAYSPTYSGYDKADPNSAFSINSILFNITDFIGGSIGDTNFNNATNASFTLKPLYQASISGELFDDGINIGSNQSSFITTVQNSVRSTTGTQLLIEFGKGARIVQDALNMLYSKSGNPSISLVEGHQTQVTDLAPVVPYSTVLPFTSTALLTKTTQVAGVPINPSDVNYFSTHIKYDLDGNTIVYNSDIIGKANYWNNAGISSNFAGIKVSGVSTSSNTGEVVANQFANDITVLGSINRASLKKDIISKAYSFINQVTPNNGVDTNYQITDLQDFSVNSDGVKLQGGNVLYFGGLNGEVVTLGDIFGANQGELVTGKKTIVIVGGNLYIKSNMYYGNKNSDILGIIVLESPTDPTKGGNVYIDPSVTNVVGNVFADKSLISFNGVAELDGGATFDELKNQLHIYGSVYSENTIGGSRTTPVKCPYYVDSSVCSTSDQAQKYDLNFLRRYFIGGSGAPSKNGKVIGGGTCVGTSCSGGNASFARNIITTTDKYGKYPVVIEYQPLLSTTPPPLFNK